MQIKNTLTHNWNEIDIIGLMSDAQSAYFNFISDMEKNQSKETPVSKQIMYNLAKNFQDTIYKNLNARYKTSVHKIQPNSSHKNLYPRSINRQEFKRIISSCYSQYCITDTNDGKFHPYKKYQFSVEFLRKLIARLYCFLRASYEHVDLAQFYISYAMMLLEYFNLTDIDWEIAKATLTTFTNCEYKPAFEQEIIRLKTKIEDINAAPVKKKNRPVGIKYRKKSDKIDVAEIIRYRATHQAEDTKKYFAEKYNVSRRTIHKVMQENYLINAYNNSQFDL